MGLPLHMGIVSISAALNCAARSAGLPERQPDMFNVKLR